MSDIEVDTDSEATISETQSEMLYRMRALDMSDDESDVHDEAVEVFADADADVDMDESDVDSEETDTDTEDDTDASYSDSSGSDADDEEEEPGPSNASNAVPPNKRKRSIPSRATLDLEILEPDFKRAVDEAKFDNVELDPRAMLALQVAAEDYSYDLFKAANGIALTAGRVTVYSEDLDLVLALSHEKTPCTNGEKELFFAKKPFQRLVKEVLEDFGTQQVSVEAYTALQVAAESFLEERFTGTALVTTHMKRQVSTPKHFQLEQWIQETFQW